MLKSDTRTGKKKRRSQQGSKNIKQISNLTCSVMEQAKSYVELAKQKHYRKIQRVHISLSDLEM